MSIHHVAYLFDHQLFRQTLLALTDPRQPLVVSHASLRNHAMKCFRDKESVRILADYYGGWDESSLLSELGDNEWFESWIHLILYSTFDLAVGAERMGLGHYWRDAAPALRNLRFGPDAEAAVFGYPMSALLCHAAPTDRPVTCSKDLRVLMSRMQPGGTSGGIGWLPYDAVSAYHWLLKDAASSDDERNREIFKRLQVMFSLATERGCGLCLIWTG